MKKVEELIKKIDRENLKEKLKTVSQRLKKWKIFSIWNFHEGTCEIRYAIGKEQFANFLLKMKNLPEIKRERIFSHSNNREKN